MRLKRTSARKAGPLTFRVVETFNHNPEKAEQGLELWRHLVRDQHFAAVLRRVRPTIRAGGKVRSID